MVDQHAADCSGSKWSQRHRFQDRCKAMLPLLLKLLAPGLLQ
jgi:hypothetical protein